jgi:hypothetical protein
VDGIRVLKLLVAATKRLSARGVSQSGDNAVLHDSAGLVFEAGEALVWFRRLSELQELLLEVTALAEAGEDEQEIEMKLARAARLAEDLAAEAGAEEGPPDSTGEGMARATLTSMTGAGGRS